MPTPVPRWARALAVVLGAVLVAHLGATALWIGPSNAAKESLRDPLSAYMEPMFQQNWSLFAPTPVSTTYALQVRGWSAEGHPTSWVDATAAETTTVTHRVLPSRVNRVSRNLARTMRNLHAELSDAEHLALGEPLDSGGWATVGERLDAVAETSEPDLVREVLVLDRTMAAYATLVAEAMWPDRDLTHVQVQIVEQEAPGYHESSAPEPHHRLFGRRPLQVFDGQDTSAFVAAFRRYAS